MSQKTEQPTPQKLREARSKGQVPRSRLFSAAGVSFVAMCAIALGAPDAAARLHGLFARLLSAPDLSASAALRLAVGSLVAIALPVLGAAFVAAVGTGVAQAGLELHAELLLPKGERIDPVAGFKRLFTVQQLLETAKAIAVAAVVSFVLWARLRDHLADAVRALRLDGVDALTAVLSLLRPAVLWGGAVLALLGAGDLLLAKRRYRRELMMTREEVKQEHKDSEGDPQHKHQRRSAHRQLAQGGPARGVQKATAIVVNPTHIAVALRYSPDECEAPYLVAKGREEDAFALRRQAQRLGIPIVRDVPLARALVHYDVGEEVPDELYRAAAAVLRVALDSQQPDTHPRNETP